MDVCIGLISCLCFIYALMQKILIAYCVMPLKLFSFFFFFFSGALAQHEALVRSCTFLYTVWSSNSAVLKKGSFISLVCFFMCKYTFQDNKHLQEFPIEIFPHKYKRKSSIVSVDSPLLLSDSQPISVLLAQFSSPAASLPKDKMPWVNEDGS